MEVQQASVTRTGQRAFVGAAQAAVPSLEPDCGQGEERTAGGGCPVVGEGAAGGAPADCPILSPGFDPTSLFGSAAADREPTAAPPPIHAGERQFYQALQRRGLAPDAAQLRAVAALHTSATERTWAEVLAWEQLHCGSCRQPRLLAVAERPGAVSPKARLQPQPPIYRADWVIDRCGTRVRYVVEQYNGAPEGMPLALRLDVRPALDSPQALWDRLTRTLRS